MNNILIPVDFSDHTTSTYKFAIAITGKNKETQLTILHSYNDQLLIPDSSLNTGFDNSAYANIEIIKELQQLAENNMKKLNSDIERYLDENKLSGISISTIVTSGDPEWEITKICDKIKPDFIVMGTQGVGKKGILEGSMAKKIMNKAIVPVIAVPEGNYNTNNLRIMYASNSSKKDITNIHYLLNLFENLPTSIFAVHFQLERDNYNDINRIDELKEAFTRERIMKQVHFSLIDANNKEDALEAFVEHNDINIVAFIAHKSNILSWLFKSKITKHDFFKLRLPMVALHE